MYSGIFFVEVLTNRKAHVFKENGVGEGITCSGFTTTKGEGECPEYERRARPPTIRVPVSVSAAGAHHRPPAGGGEVVAFVYENHKAAKIK